MKDKLMVFGILDALEGAGYKHFIEEWLSKEEVTESEPVATVDLTSVASTSAPTEAPNARVESVVSSVIESLRGLL